MNLGDARRIRDEAAARSLWQAGGEALNVAAVDEIIARKQAVQPWMKQRRKTLGRLLLAAVIGQFVLGFYVPFGTDAVGRAFLGLVCWVVTWIAIFIRYTANDDADLAFALRLRAGLERETDRLREVRARIARGEAFALYLRTFAAETAAMTLSNVLSRTENIRNAAEAVAVDSHCLRLDLYPARQETAERLISWLKDEWTLKHEVVRMMAAVLPVVCLGNIDLQDEKREDLAELGAVEVTLIRTDWWPVFQELETAAALSFVILDSLTTHITRELDHLVARGRPFIVACATETDQRLSANDGYRSLISHPAVRHVIFADDNLAGLEAALVPLAPLHGRL
jgi:hypothetical protein